MLKINIPISSLPLWEHMVRSKRDILFITLESFTNSILSKQRFSSLRKFKLYICLKKKYVWGYRCKIKERHDPRRWVAILPIAEKKAEKTSGSDGIWTQASQNTTINWATEVNVNSSALMPIYFYRTLHSPFIFASVIFWSLSFKCFFLSAYNKTFRNILLSKRRLILLRDFSIWICDEISFFWLAD